MMGLTQKWRAKPRILKADPGTARQGYLEMNKSELARQSQSNAEAWREHNTDQGGLR